MNKFNYNDFVSDTIPGCVLTNDKIVRQAAEQALQGADVSAKIKSVNLIGLLFPTEILLEWHVSVQIEERSALIRLPVYIPPDETLAAQQLEKHSRAAQIEDLQEIKYNPGDYFLMYYQYPCQLVLGDDGSLYIKRFVILPSQKIVQELLSDVLHCELVTATLVVSTFHTFFYKGMNDICWLLNLDGVPSMISIDRSHTQMGIIQIDKYDEFPEGQTFELNHQKYSVECDEENGIYLAKLSQSFKSKA
ncbi:MAG: hypothetical protein IJ545_02755 [Alphaproteobacteria bacterium]|nr:hypothetical protein [Alphaproteobacteria bacterium]